mgnify:CR=1 FL=1
MTETYIHHNSQHARENPKPNELAPSLLPNDHTQRPDRLTGCARNRAPTCWARRHLHLASTFASTSLRFASRAAVDAAVGALDEAAPLVPVPVMLLFIDASDGCLVAASPATVGFFGFAAGSVALTSAFESFASSLGFGPR